MWDLIVSVPDHCLSFYFAAVSLDAIVSIGPSLCSVPMDPTSYQTKVDIIILNFYKKERSKLVF